MIKNLVQKLKSMNGVLEQHNVTSPILKSENKFLTIMSERALNLYERKSDIKKFTRLAMSNPEDSSHENIIDELFAKGIAKDYLSDDNLIKLSDNSKILKDLNL